MSCSRYDDSTWAAAPNWSFSTQARTTLVTSEPTASATVTTLTGRPVLRATRTASAIASECGDKYNDMATVGTPSVKSSTSRPVMPASQRPSGTL